MDRHLHIPTQVEQRGAARLRKYCVCMQQIVEDNQPFENVTALERTYPPAHQMCWNDAGRR